MSELTAADGAEADTPPVELILLRCPEVFCYKVPPQASAAGHRAEDWNLGEPRFTGRLHRVAEFAARRASSLQHGRAAHEKEPGADGEPLRCSVPGGDANLEFAPSNPPQPDM